MVVIVLVYRRGRRIVAVTVVLLVMHLVAIVRRGGW